MNAPDKSDQSAGRAFFDLFDGSEVVVNRPVRYESLSHGVNSDVGRLVLMKSWPHQKVMCFGWAALPVPELNQPRFG